jgi:glutathione synthase
MREIVDIVGPKLVRDGMFLVGLDIVGDKLMEINVFSPGGLGSATEFTGIDFADLVVEDLERKVAEQDRAAIPLMNAVAATA